MKILLLSDEESPLFWDYYQPSRVEGVDLILSSGDLAAEYLSFLVTMTNLPLLYVHGNHDGTYDERPPEGCRCIDGQLVTVNGLRILGLGGSMRYNGGPHQYTEAQMARRVQLARLRTLRSGAPDIVLAHAPLAGFGDRPDPAHRGYRCLLSYVEDTRPRYFIHGHVHQRYLPDFRRIRQLGGTTVINASGYYLLDTDRTP